MMLIDDLSFGVTTGVSSYVLLCKRPIPGDTWLVLEFAGTFIIFLAHLYTTGEVTYSLHHATKKIVYQILFLVLAAVIYRLSPFHPLYRFPGPFTSKITSLRSMYIVWGGRRFEKMVDLHKRYGTFVRTGPNTLSINSHSVIGPVYASATAWNKSKAYIMGHLPGAGLFFIQDKETHNVRKRQYWAPAFTNKAVSSYYPMVDRHVDTLLNVLPTRYRLSDGSIELSTAFEHWIHDVTMELTFGDASDVNLLEEGDPRNLVRGSLSGVQTFEILAEVPSLFDVLWYFPTTESVRGLDEMAKTALKARMQLRTSQNDLISHLLGENHCVGEEVPPLDQVHLNSEALLAIQAGTNGPSAALIFAFFYILSHPAVYDRLRSEIHSAFPDSDGGTHVDHNTLIHLPYLNAVVEESLRLGAPLGYFSRVTPEGGAYLAGEYIPQDTIIGVPAWTQMISEDNFYPDPLEFRPERWLPEGLGPETKTNKAAIMTFSHGPFGCIGKNLAAHELRLPISKMLLRYNMKFPPDFSPDLFLQGVRNMRVTSFLYPLRVILS